MADPTVPRRDFYVYALFREDGFTPFWIGRGCGRRINKHETEVKPGASHKDNIVWGMKSRGIPVPKAKLLECLTLRESMDIEADLIWLIMRAPNGPLANIVGGGGGMPDPPASTRAKMSAARRGRKLSDETRAKMRAAAQRRTPEQLANQRASTQSAATRAKMSAARRGKPKSPEHRAKMAASSRNMSPEIRARIGLAHRGKIVSEETRAKLRAARTNISAETRAKIGAAARGRRHSEETKERIRQISSMYRHSPETLARMRIAQKLSWEKRKSQRK